MWNNLRFGLLIVVLALLLVCWLFSGVEKKEVKVDKYLLCDGVELSVEIK